MINNDKVFTASCFDDLAKDLLCKNMVRIMCDENVKRVIDELEKLIAVGNEYMVLGNKKRAARNYCRILLICKKLNLL